MGGEEVCRSRAFRIGIPVASSSELEVLDESDGDRIRSEFRLLLCLSDCLGVVWSSSLKEEEGIDWDKDLFP